MTEPTHLFIGAAPRSGTTQLVEALQAHPDVTIVPECRFIQYYFSRGFPPQETLTEEQADLLENLMRADLKLSLWPHLEISSWLETNLPFAGCTVSDVIDRLFTDYAQAAGTGTRIIGNKKNLYAAGLGPYTREAFPQARFIFMIRDPRDVVRSHGTLLEPTLEPICHDLVYRYGNMKEMANRFPDAVHIQRFEDLVTQPEQALNTLLTFLNLPPSDASLLALQSAVADADPSAPPPALSEDNLRLIESITTPILDEQGYPTRD